MAYHPIVLVLVVDSWALCGHGSIVERSTVIARRFGVELVMGFGRFYSRTRTSTTVIGA